LSLQDWKTVVEMAYQIVAILAALAALYLYRRNSRLERSRWATTLFEKFYENGRYKEVRSLLDNPAESSQIADIVLKDDAKFTDYLNFFEYVAFLKESKQLREQEVEVLFGYFLDCLQRHERVLAYIRDPENGYEKLRAFLDSRTKKLR
jgi:hypothetical protein